MGTGSADREFMQQAIALSRRCKSEPGKISPKVGAVLVREGAVLGDAYRGEFAPGDHAEFTALEKKCGEHTLAGATLFTTLEPCTFRSGSKLPCVERIIDRRIARVVIGVLDPNPRICGAGELRLRDAGIEIARFDADLMAQIEELNRDFARPHRSSAKLERSHEATVDPVGDGQRGPNGYRIGYTPEGDKVEWLPAEDDPSGVVPLLLRRNDETILAAHSEAWDKVWWNRHQAWVQRLNTGKEKLSPQQQGLFRSAEEAARRLEEKYGRDTLGWNDFEWGMLSGRLSALAWVLGAEWEESLDT